MLLDQVTSNKDWTDTQKVNQRKNMFLPTSQAFFLCIEINQKEEKDAKQNIPGEDCGQAAMAL
jgi:hypothetical protein